jgi:polar amino acid transport system substrate-binding protein/glutamate/aspartate transport system substrate-binding protein
VLLRRLLWLVDRLPNHSGLQYVLMLRCALSAALALAITAPQAWSLSICYRADAAPFSYLDANGRPTGYSVALCRLVAERDGAPPKMVQVTAEERFKALDAGSCDMLCEATTVTMNRRRNGVEFSLITFLTGTALLFPRSLLEESERAGPVRVGFLEGTTTHDKYESRMLVSGDGVAFEFRPQASHEDAVEGLKTGELGAYLADREIIEGILTNNPTIAKTHVLGADSLSYEPYAIALKTGNDDILIKIDDVLADLFRSGQIFDLIAEHVPNRLYDARLKDLFLIQSLPE